MTIANKQAGARAKASSPAPAAPAGHAPKAARAKPLAVREAGAAYRAHGGITFWPSKGVDDFVRQVFEATPLQLVEMERLGVTGAFLKALSDRMEVPAGRVFAMLGVPKATAERKAVSGEVVKGSGGQAAIGMARLLGIAQRIVANATASQAARFDSAKWLGVWLERPQPSLGGRKPGDLIDTPTGIDVVARLLGALESGAYQ